MALPEQIRKQAEAIKAHYDDQQTTTPEGTTPEQEQEITDPVITEPVANTETVEQTTPTTTEQVEDGNSETWQQRYRSLQGMYNAEVPRLRTSSQENEQRVRQLEELLSSLSQQQTPATTAPLTHEPTVVHLSDNERSEYGESIDVMRKVSREELSPLFARLAQLESGVNQLVGNIQTTVVPQVQRLASTQAQSQDERFWNGLAAAVPNWQQINNDTGFQNWLLDVDPLTGVSRQTHLEAAQKNLDANRVAAFFKTWTEQTGKYSTNATTQPTRSAQASELEKQVTPGRSRSAAAPSTQAKKTYTRSDVARFFDDVSKGKYKGNEAERNRIERDIFAAQQEGRIAVA